MREILFRGQTRRHGEKVRVGDGQKLPGNWVYGGIFPGSGDFSIIYGGNSETLEITTLDKHPVYSDTVGQYTGLQDKNGKRIFEGDVVRFKWDKERNYFFFIEFVDGEFCATPIHCLDDVWQFRIRRENEKIEVIGNIHDNPELIGCGDDG